MLQYSIRILAAICLITGLTACANYRAMNRIEEMDRQIKADRVEFYQRLSDAYRILAFEYYKLAADAEKQKASKLAADYKARMTLYDTFYRQAKKNAEELRLDMQAPANYDLPTLPQPEGGQGVALEPARGMAEPEVSQPSAPNRAAPPARGTSR